MAGRSRRDGSACGAAMHLSDHDLRQLDDAYLEGLTPEQARVLLWKALAALKPARERLAQDPSNSSRPPSTRAPWEGVAREPEADVSDGGAGSTSGDAAGAKAEQPASADTSHLGRTGGAAKPARRKDAPGHSRTQTLTIDAERAPAVSRKCWDMVVSEWVLDDARMPRVVAHFVSLPFN